MVLEFIYGTPTLLWGTILVTLLTGAACLGLLIFHHFVQFETRRAHNELTGFVVAVISVTYAVLLAFIAIATWESYSAAGEMVDREADLVGSIYRDTQGLPGDMGDSIRADLRDYVRIVVNDEWPVQEAGKTPSQGWTPLHKLHSAIVTLKPADPGETVIEAELLRTLNQLYSARASRLSAVEGHIPAVIWWIIFLGGALVTGFTYLFGFHDIRMHLVTTSAVTISMALVVVLIIALDWPFRGEVSASPAAFIKAQRSWAGIPFSDAHQAQPDR